MTTADVDAAKAAIAGATGFDDECEFYARTALAAIFVASAPSPRKAEKP